MLEQIFCPYCASAPQVVDVHGHKQCVNCGINISPCCSGEPMTEYEVADVVSAKKIKNQLVVIDLITPGIKKFPSKK